MADPLCHRSFFSWKDNNYTIVSSFDRSMAASVVIQCHHTSYRSSSLPEGSLLCCTVPNRRTLQPFGNMHGGRPPYKLFRHSLKPFSSLMVTALPTTRLYHFFTHTHTQVPQNVPKIRTGNMSRRSGRERLSVLPKKGGTLSLQCKAEARHEVQKIEYRTSGLRWR